MSQIQTSKVNHSTNCDSSNALCVMISECLNRRDSNRTFWLYKLTAPTTVPQLMPSLYLCDFIQCQLMDGLPKLYPTQNCLQCTKGNTDKQTRMPNLEDVGLQVSRPCIGSNSKKFISCRGIVNLSFAFSEVGLRLYLSKIISFLLMP